MEMRLQLVTIQYILNLWLFSKKIPFIKMYLLFYILDLLYQIKLYGMHLVFIEL